MDGLVEQVAEAIQQAISEGVPEAKVSPWSKPGFTEDIKAECQKAIRLRRRWQRTRTQEAYDEYTAARAHKGRVISKGLRDTHRERVEEAAKDPQGVYKLHKWAKQRGMTRQSFTPAIERPLGDKTDEPEEKVQRLRNSFFPVPPEADESDMVGTAHTSSIKWVPFTDNEVMNAIKRPGPWKAPGPDGIPNRILQLTATLLAPILRRIYNRCMELGHQPQAWRTSTTVALRKPQKEDYTKPKSWRPIALLNTMGKVLDSMIAQRISYWTEEEGLLPPGHMGGRKNIGVEQAIHLLLERIHSTFGYGSKKPVASLLMLDVSGPYDNVSHKRLLHNMSKRGRRFVGDGAMFQALYRPEQPLEPIKSRLVEELEGQGLIGQHEK